ncbi:citrate lyase holo-[acyl-carrier protein] synthase [Clostridium sp. DL1XJH146]
MDNEQRMIYKILESREQRAEKQKSLIKEFDGSLISFTLNIPGARKDSLLFRKAHEEGFRLLVEAIEKDKLPILYKEEIHKDTGSEGYISVQADSLKLKALTILIEEKTPLGRIFDIDVLNKSLAIISRKDLGYEGRKCFVCNGEANICRKERKHSTEELIDYINEMTKDYFNLNDN